MTPKLAKILFILFLIAGTLIPIVYNVWQKQEAAQAARRSQMPELKTSTPASTVAPVQSIAPAQVAAPQIASPSPTPLLQFSINRGQGGFGDDD